MELYLEYWFTFFFIFPIAEWGLHYIMHKYNITFNNNHNEIVKKYKIQKIVNLNIEYWPIIPIILCLYNTFFIGVLFFSKYYIIHTLIHRYPRLLPDLTYHHNIHHIYSNYNYCVTNIWPDKLFGTQYIN